MKKIYALITLLAAASGFVSCSDNDEVMNNALPASTPEVVEVHAYTGAETRTLLDNEYNVLWASSDKIMIGPQEFTLSEGAGSSMGTFTGTAPADGEYTAYYPSTYKGAIWPEQKYAGAGNISGAPMVATATVSNGEIDALKFKNVGGVLRYTVKGSKSIKSINVKGNGLDITLDCGDGVALTSEGTVFNIALPEGSYSNAKLTFRATDGMMAIKTAATFKVTKNMVSKATFEATDLSFQPSAYSIAGTTDIIYGRKAVVVDLGGGIGKVAIAATNVDGHCNYDEVVTNPDCQDGWYIPSAHELKLFSTLFSVYSQWTTDSETGAKGRVWNIEGHPLFLPADGYEANEEIALEDRIGVYVSKDINGPCFYSLNFDENTVTFADNMTTDASIRYSVRLFHKLEGNLPLPTIGYNVTEGTYGMFHGQEAVVVNLGGKLYAMATKNIGADRPSDFGNYYTASGANNAANNIQGGWRLPLDTELKALIDTYSTINGKSEWTTQNGVHGWQINFNTGNTLFFPKAGYSVSDGKVIHEGQEGMYCAQNATGSEGKYLYLYENATIMQTTASPTSHEGNARLIRNMELLSSDPVGTIGYLDGRLGIVADLGGSLGKVAIALYNEGATSATATDPKYTWSQAHNLEGNGWHLPSDNEFEAFVNNYGSNIYYDVNGKKGATWKIGENSLYMPYTSYIDKHDRSADGYFCWSSTYSSIQERHSHFCIKIERNGFQYEGICGIEKPVTWYPETTLFNVRFFHKLQ